MVRSYPEGKKFLCCICGNTSGSFPNFNRHFENNHPNTLLVVSGFCSVCGKKYPNAKAASVHCKVSHGVSKKKNSKIATPDTDSTPIKSFILEKLSNGDQVEYFDSPKIIIDHQLPCTSSLTSTNSYDFGEFSLRNDSSIPADQQDLPLDEVSNNDSILITPTPLSHLPPISKSSVHVTSTRPAIYDQICPGVVIQTPTSQMINECVTDLLSNHTPQILPRPILSTRLSINPPNSSLLADILVGNRFTPSARRSRQRIYRRNSSPHIFACDELSDLADSLSVIPDPNLTSDHVIPSNTENIPPNMESTSTDQLCPNQQDYVVDDQDDGVVDIPSSIDIQSENHMPSITNSTDPLPLNLNQMNEKLCDFQKKWTDIFSSNCSWEEFCGNCSNFVYESKEFIVNTASTKPHNPAPRNIPNHPPKHPPFGRGFHHFDKAEAQKIQALYYCSKKKAARKILSNNSPTYTGSINSAEAYF